MRLITEINLCLFARYLETRQQHNCSSNIEVNASDSLLKQIQLFRGTLGFVNWKFIQDEPIQKIQFDPAQLRHQLLLTYPLCCCDQ